MDTFPEVELLDCMLVPLIFEDPPLLSIFLLQSTIPPTMHNGSLSPHPCQHLLSPSLWDDEQSERPEVIIHRRFNLHFPKTSNVQHAFHTSVSLLLYPLENATIILLPDDIYSSLIKYMACKFSFSNLKLSFHFADYFFAGPKCFI